MGGSYKQPEIKEEKCLKHVQVPFLVYSSINNGPHLRKKDENLDDEEVHARVSAIVRAEVISKAKRISNKRSVY